MKSFFASKTIWGIILTILQVFLKQHNIELPLLGAEGGEALTAGFGAFGMRDAMGGGLTLNKKN